MNALSPKPRLARTLRWIGIVYAAYLLTCLLILMPAMNVLAPGLVRDALGRELRSELLLFNPFSNAFEARGISLHEDNGHLPLAFSRLKVNLSLASLWQPGIVLDEFLLEGLDVHVLRQADGGFHFDDLLESEDSAPTDSTASIPYLTVREVLIDAHTLRYTDRTRPGPFTTVQRDLRIRKRNLTTVPDRSGDGVLELTSDGGGRLSWKGTVDIAAGRSAGQLTLQQIDLTPLWRYEAGSLDFIAHSARLNSQLNYQVEWNNELQFTLDDSSLQLTDLDIGPRDDVAIPDTRIRLADIHVEGIGLNLANEDVEIAQLSIAGIDVQGYDDNGEPSLMLLFANFMEEDPENPTDPDDRESDGDEAEDDEPSTWTLKLAQLDLDNSIVSWRTDYLAPESIRVAPLTIHASALRWPADDASPFSLALTVNEQTQLNVDGAVQIQRGEGTINVSLNALHLPWLNPLVNEQARTDISRGTLALNTALTLNAFSPERVTGQLQIDDFATVLHDSEQEAFTLQQLALEGVAIDIPTTDISIKRLLLQRPTGSLYIRKDGTINVNGVVRERPQAAQNAGGNTEDPDDSEPWRVLLEQLALQDGQLDFADDSLPIPFKTLIADINADAESIDTSAASSLNLTMKGSVDGYAPVLIEGSGRPLAPSPNGKLRLNFRGVDIATMSPYSGTYAGYSIDSGTLSLDLNYTLKGSTIQGDNQVLISQMQLGEPVESALAVKVPLKLGLALLTDSKGVIDLAVPVSGNLDDPQFSLGGVIGKAITNVIVKAVTAPFKLLAGLVGSDEDLENIAFVPGTSELSAEGASTLATLAEALNQRPQLNLRIAGSVDDRADSLAIAEALLGDMLIAEGLDPASLALKDAAFQEQVERRFLAMQATAEPRPVQEEKDVGNVDPPTSEEQWQALLAGVDVSDAALSSLGTARAAAAKKELVMVSGIDAARIAITYDGTLGLSGVKMVVDS